MKKIKLQSLIRDRRGLTLVEAVVSAALVAILALTLAMAVSASLTAVHVTRERTNGADAAASQIESQRAGSPAVGSISGTLTINFGSTNYSVNGSYITGTDSGINYKEFVPNN